MDSIIRKRNKKILIIALLSVVSQCFSTPVLGIDYNIVDNMGVLTRAIENGSDQFIKSVTSRVDQYVNKNIKFTTNLAKSCFSILEKQPGLNENNNVFKSVKNKALVRLGMSFEAARETKGLAEMVFSSAIRSKIQPIQLINLGLEIKKDPQKILQNEIKNVKKLANWGANALFNTASALLKPQLVLKGLKQSYRDTKAKIKDDPIKRENYRLKR